MATEIDRLITVYDANWTRMEEKLNKVIRANQRAAKSVEQSWKGADKALSNIKGGLLSSLAPGADRFATALGSLGAAGVAAGIGIGSAIAAFAAARKAISFADEIGDTADRLHVTTDALQEYRAAIQLAGGDTKGADEALEGFSQTLGKAKEGLAKSVRAFEAVGISEEQIASFKSTDEALQAVVAAMEGLSDAEKDAVIQQFGLGGLKQLIDGGTDAMNAYIRRAREAGVVMDAGMIKKAGELNDELELSSAKIKNELHEGFVSLGPVIVWLVGLIAGMAEAVGDVVSQFEAIENRSTRALRKTQRQLTREVTRLGVKQIAGTPLSGSEQTALNNDIERLGRINEELGDRVADAAAEIKAAAPVTKHLIEKADKAAKADKDKNKLTPIEMVTTAGGAEATEVRDALDWLDEVIKASKKPVPFEAPDTSGITLREDADKELQQLFAEAQRGLHDGVKAGIMGGLEAGFRDGLPGVLHYLEDALLKSVLDSVAEGLTNAVLSGSQGGTGGLITSLASALFGPKYAAGTMSSRHGMALVGERGPEMVNLPGGSQVISNSALRNVAMGGRGSGGTVINFDNRGAVIWEQAARQMMTYADRAAVTSGVGAVHTARQATPADLARQNARRLGR